LQSALNYARAAVEDATSDELANEFLSVFSNDLVGSQCLLVSVLKRLGQKDEAMKVADQVLTSLFELYESFEPKHDCSVLYGLSGALQAIWFLRRELEDEKLGSEFALTVSSNILLEGLEHSEKYESTSLLMWEWRGRPFLGAGTGAVGILFSLLGHSEEEWMSLNECLPRFMDVIRQSIDSLADHKHESGNLKTAIDGFDEDRSTDWRNGAPGYCLLLLRAYEVFGDSKYLEQARDMAERVIWPRRMQRNGVGLSRGVVGMAYSLLALARVEQEENGNWMLWRSRAEKMAELAFGRTSVHVQLSMVS